VSEDLEKADFFLKESHKFFDSLYEQRKRLDDKIHNMIVLSSVLTTITFGLSYFIIERNLLNKNMWLPAALLVFSVVLYCLVAFIGICTYDPTMVYFRSSKKMIEEYDLYEDQNENILTIMRRIAWNLSRDAEENREINMKKAKDLKKMLYLLFLGVSLLMVAFILVILST